MEYIFLLALGIVMIVLSVPGLKGNASTVHWYNRRRVSKEDMSKYGRAMGAGSLIIGAAAAATAVLQMIFDLEAIFYLLAGGVLAGLAVMIYAQFKYNKGIF